MFRLAAFVTGGANIDGALLLYKNASSKLWLKDKFMTEKTTDHFDIIETSADPVVMLPPSEPQLGMKTAILRKPIWAAFA